MLRPATGIVSGLAPHHRNVSPNQSYGTPSPVAPCRSSRAGRVCRWRFLLWDVWIAGPTPARVADRGLRQAEDMWTGELRGSDDVSAGGGVPRSGGRITGWNRRA